MLKIIKSPIFQIVIVMIAMALFDPGKAGYKIKEFSLVKASGFLILSLTLLSMLILQLLNFHKISSQKQLQIRDIIFIYMMFIVITAIVIVMIFAAIVRIFLT